MKPKSDPPKNRDKKRSANRNPSKNGIQMDDAGFKQFLEAIPDGLVIVNAQGEIQFVNKQVEGMFGYQPEEMRGKPVELLIPERFSGHKENREAYTRNLHARPMGSGLELLAIRKDDTEFRADISLSPLVMEGETYIIAAIRDVTARRLSEKQLLQSFERYQQTLDNMLEGCQIIDFEWRYIYVNNVAASQRHRKPDEILMRTMMEVYPGIENTELFTALKHCMEARVSEHIESKFENSDGSAGWFELSIRPVPEGIFILSIDITERKLAEINHQQNEKRFQALVEQSMEEISLVDAKVTLIFESPTTRRPLGYPPGSFLGHNLFELFHPDDQAAAIELLEQVAGQPGANREALFRLRHMDGSWRWMEGILTNLLDEPAIGAIVINYRDVTERKMAEEALRASEERYRGLFEDSPISLWEEDFSAVKQRLDALREQGVTDLRAYLISHPEVVAECAALVKVVDVNKAGLELSRAKSKQDLLKNLGEVLPEETLDNFRDELARLSEGETKFDWEGINLTLTGERRDVHITVSVAPIHEHDLSKVIVSVVDITERKQAEEEIRTRTDELRTLYELSRALADANDLEEILNQVNRHAVDSVHTTFARVALLEGDNFVMRAAYPVRVLDHDLLVGKREPVAMLPYCQHVLEQNKSVILRNSSQEVSIDERAALLLDFAQTLCLIPLRVYDSELNSSHTLGLLMLGEARQEGREPFTPEKIRLARSIGDQAAIAIDNARLFNNLQRSNSDLRRAYDATIEGWSAALDLRDKETEGHTQRVTERTVSLAKALGFGQQELVAVRRGALLHDIGKMGVPDRILLKPGPLTDEEWVMMRKHPTFAYEMLTPISYLGSALDIPYCHHEKWDGSGYPRGLEGEQIPISARLFAVVDVYDALTSDRPYRAGWPKEKVLEHIRSLSGSHFDPQVVEVFLKMVGEDAA